MEMSLEKDYEWGTETHLNGKDTLIAHGLKTCKTCRLKHFQSYRWKMSLQKRLLKVLGDAK